MNKSIKNEFDQFKLYHKNIYNINTHIFCGFVYMSFLLLLLNNSNINQQTLIFLYCTLILFTMNSSSLIFNRSDKSNLQQSLDPPERLNSLFISLIMFIILLTLTNMLSKYNISKLTLFILFLFFYFLPELSHKLTNEKTVLNINNITPFSIFVNIFYLLPFSIKCLFYIE